MNDIVFKNKEQFLTFKIFSDRLSAVERKFNADDLFTLKSTGINTENIKNGPSKPYVCITLPS